MHAEDGVAALFECLGDALGAAVAHAEIADRIIALLLAVSAHAENLAAPFIDNEHAA